MQLFLHDKPWRALAQRLQHATEEGAPFYNAALGDGESRRVGPKPVLGPATRLAGPRTGSHLQRKASRLAADLTARICAYPPDKAGADRYIEPRARHRPGFRRLSAPLTS